MGHHSCWRKHQHQFKHAAVCSFSSTESWKQLFHQCPWLVVHKTFGPGWKPLLIILVAWMLSARTQAGMHARSACWTLLELLDQPLAKAFLAVQRSALKPSQQS